MESIRSAFGFSPIHYTVMVEGRLTRYTVARDGLSANVEIMDTDSTRFRSMGRVYVGNRPHRDAVSAMVRKVLAYRPNVPRVSSPSDIADDLAYRAYYGKGE